MWLFLLGGPALGFLLGVFLGGVPWRVSIWSGVPPGRSGAGVPVRCLPWRGSLEGVDLVTPGRSGAFLGVFNWRGSLEGVDELVCSSWEVRRWGSWLGVFGTGVRRFGLQLEGVR